MSIERPIDTLHARPAKPGEVASHAGRQAEDLPTLSVQITLPDGATHRCDAAEGFKVMELIRAAGLPLVAECGGAGVCATCHVRVGAAWKDRLPPPTDDELAKLDEIPAVGECSRLACQIEMNEALDGLELTIAADSVRLATANSTANR